MESSRALRSPARVCRPEAVKKLTGLSSALLTFLPVARRFCVVLINLAVFCNASRFCRTPAESTMSLMTGALSKSRPADSTADCLDNDLVTLMPGKKVSNNPLRPGEGSEPTRQRLIRDLGGQPQSKSLVIFYS